MDDLSNCLYKTNMVQLPHHIRSFTHHPDPAWLTMGYSVRRAGHVEAAPDSVLERQNHEGQDILFCLSGGGAVSSLGLTTGVSRHQLAWLANETPHGHRADRNDPWELMWVRIVGADASGLRRRIFGENKTILNVGEPAGMRTWFERLFATLERRDTALDIELNQLVGTLLLLLIESRDERRDFGPALPHPVTKAIAAMRSDLSYPWSASDLERICRVSATHLRRQFSAHLQKSPHQWLLHERLVKAQNLLADTNLSVTEIGATCGFSDVFHFSRKFKHHIGSSPTHWRKSEKIF